MSPPSQPEEPQHLTPTLPSSTEKPSVLHRGTLLAILVSTRPKQWIKNVLTLAPVAAAANLTNLKLDLRSLAAAVFFILASSGIYLINDTRDIEADTRHPKKSLRPIAAGELSPITALRVGFALLALGISLPFLLVNYQLGLVVAIYSIINVSYVYYLKTEVVFDIVSVSLGFLLRAIAGGAAGHIPLSNWFLIVASFGSLFMVAGKRYSELVVLKEDASNHRHTLNTYSLGFLNFVRGVAAAISITAYCLWAFEKAAIHPANSVVLESSILPFVLGLMLYAQSIEEGVAGAPEEVVLGNRRLQIVGIVWIISLISGLYLAQ